MQNRTNICIWFVLQKESRRANKSNKVCIWDSFMKMALGCCCCFLPPITTKRKCKTHTAIGRGRQLEIWIAKLRWMHLKNRNLTNNSNGNIRTCTHARKQHKWQKRKMTCAHDIGRKIGLQTTVMTMTTMTAMANMKKSKHFAIAGEKSGSRSAGQSDEVKIQSRSVKRRFEDTITKKKHTCQKPIHSNQRGEHAMQCVLCLCVS